MDQLLPRAYGVPVLMYHSISTKASQLAIAPDAFDEQLAWLSARGFRSIEPEEVLTAEPNGHILITFDDGFKENLQTAAPLLEKHGYTATIFVSTDYLGGNSGYAERPSDKTFEMLTDGDVKELAGLGWTIANHFHTHRVLSELSADEIRSEYDNARARLGELGVPEQHQKIVAYPRSRMSAGTLQALRQLGVSMAFTGGRRVCTTRDPRLALPRIGITPDISLRELELLLSPTYSRLKRGRTAVAKVVRRRR
jgi:peptidoglycan/xylan/chitin deacetylase (PgdA/CDA1 family)